MDREKIDFLQVAVGAVTRGEACSSLMIWCSSSIVLGATPHGGSHGTSDGMCPGVDHLRTTHSEMVEGIRERRRWEEKNTNRVPVTSGTRFDCHADRLPATKKKNQIFREQDERKRGETAPPPEPRDEATVLQYNDGDEWTKGPDAGTLGPPFANTRRGDFWRRGAGCGRPGLTGHRHGGGGPLGESPARKPPTWLSPGSCKGPTLPPRGNISPQGYKKSIKTCLEVI